MLLRGGSITRRASARVPRPRRGPEESGRQPEDCDHDLPPVVIDFNCQRIVSAPRTTSRRPTPQQPASDEARVHMADRSISGRHRWDRRGRRTRRRIFGLWARRTTHERADSRARGRVKRRVGSHIPGPPFPQLVGEVPRWAAMHGRWQAVINSQASAAAKAPRTRVGPPSLSSQGGSARRSRFRRT